MNSEPRCCAIRCANLPHCRRLLWGSVACALLAGCDFRGAPVSEACFDVCRTIYNVCSLENAAQAAQLMEVVDSAQRDGRITVEEAEQLKPIVAQARAGRWADARTAARRFLAAQSRRR